MSSGRVRLLALACVCAATAGTVAAAFAAASPVHAQIRFKPAGKPVVYLRFEGNRLYLASSAEGLATAKPLQPATGDLPEEAMSYAPVDLPVVAPGITKAVVAFSIRRSSASPFVGGEFRITRRDKSGALWEYVYNAGGPVRTATSPEKPYVIEVPSFDKYTLGVETKVERGKVGIGLRVKAEGQDIREAKKGGKPAAARLQVLDARGKVIQTATGDLEKFGFT